MTQDLEFLTEDERMYLVSTAIESPGERPGGHRNKVVWALGVLAGMRAWWQERVLQGQRLAKDRQLCVLESVQLGPKQRVVLLKCGADRFLVGTGTEGVQSIVRVATDAGGQPRCESHESWVE